MSNRKQGINPFYVLLAVVGTAFVVTAFAYGLMAFNTVNPTPATAAQAADHPLWQMLRRHGSQLLLWEVALLAVLSVAAIGTDRFWSGRARRRALRSDDFPDQTNPVDTPKRSPPA